QLARASRIAAGESTVRILLGKGFSLQILKKFKVLFIRNYGGLAQLARASRIAAGESTVRILLGKGFSL
uniref:hypothetical protein n=1 Tax=Algoriphagus sp. TaxID=1872435 RepID=UPI004047FACE